MIIKLDAMPETMTTKQDVPILSFKSTSDINIVKCRMWYIVIISLTSLKMSSFDSKEDSLAFEFLAATMSKIEDIESIYICTRKEFGA